MWGILIGGVSKLFYSGDLGTFLLAETFIRSLVGGGIVALIACRFGAGWALIILPVAVPPTDRLYFVVLGFLLLNSEKLLSNSYLWLLSYVAIACSTVL